MFIRICKELASKEERMKLLRYYFYSMLIVHEDMHTKNLSLIFDGSISLMAPLYDIATTSIYPLLKGYESHLTIDGQQSNITPKNFKKLVDITGIKWSVFKKEADLIIEAYVNILPSYIERLSNITPEPTVRKLRRKARRGDLIYVVDVTTPPFTLVSILLSKHAQRIKGLKELAWISEK
jgi:serine/threonine-protein kinase HipA